MDVMLPSQRFKYRLQEKTKNKNSKTSTDESGGVGVVSGGVNESDSELDKNSKNGSTSSKQEV